MSTTNVALKKGSSKSKLGKDFDANMDTIDKIVAGKNIVTFSATPAFDASLGQLQQITLTGNVTSSTITNGKTGQRITLEIIQDSGGGHTVVYPTNVKNALPVLSAGNAVTTQSLTFDGTNWFAATVPLPVEAINTVTYSATPTFNCALGSLQKITLTGDVSSSTITNPVNGQTLTLAISQDSGGSHTFAFPANVKGGTAISATASKTSVQSFVFDGTNWLATAAGTNFS